MRLLLLGLIFCSATLLQAQKSKEPKVVSGTVLVNNRVPLDAQALMAAIKSDWKIKADSINIADKTIVFSTPLATVMIAQLDYPADPIEIKAAARLAWLWPNADAEAVRHQSQVVISVIGSDEKPLELHLLFSKVAAAVLESASASGVYMNSQYLLLPKGFYSAAAHNMLDNQSLPVYCWVYFGRPGDGGGYTYGLQEFGLTDLEIVKSERPEADVHAVLYDAVYALIKYNTKLTDGQSLVTEEGLKLAAKRSKAVFLEGLDVFQLGY